MIQVTSFSTSKSNYTSKLDLGDVKRYLWNVLKKEKGLLAAVLLCSIQQWSVGLITLPNNFEKILDKTEKKKVKKVELDDNNNSSSTEDGDRIGLEVDTRFFLLYCCHLGDLCWTLQNWDFKPQGSPKSAPAWTVILHQTTFNLYQLNDYDTFSILRKPLRVILWKKRIDNAVVVAKTNSYDFQQDLPCYGPATGDQRCGEVQFESWSSELANRKMS